MYRNLNDYEIIYMVRESSDSFKVLYDKYKPVTDVLFDFQKRWSTSIDQISYQYYPKSDIDIVYNLPKDDLDKIIHSRILGEFSLKRTDTKLRIAYDNIQNYTYFVYLCAQNQSFNGL